MIAMRLGVVSSVVVLLGVACVRAPMSSQAGAEAPASSPPPMPIQNGTLACDSVTLVDLRPTCIVPLSEEVRARRETYIALVVKDGNPVRVERRHGSGGYSPYTGLSIVQYELEGGKVRRSIDRHADGHMLEQILFEETGKLRLYRDVAGHPRREEGSDATRSRVELDARGFERERRFYDENGKAVRGKMGAHMMRYEHDDAGSTIHSAAFDERGVPTLTNEGWHRQEDSFGPNGCMARRAIFGTRGERVLEKDGISGFRRQCDPAGQPMLTEYLGVDDRPAVNLHGHAGWAARRDEHGNPIEVTTLGLDGKPVLGDRDYAVERRQFDAAGHHIESAFFGPTGVPITLASGYSVIRHRWRGDHIVETRYFDEGGRPITASRIGYAIVRFEHDDRGRVSSISYFDDQGRPVYDRTGAATREYGYDGADHVVIETLLEGGRPHEGRDGWARQTTEYAPDGTVAHRRFYRATGEEVELIGDRWILVSFAGAKGTVGAIRSKQEARERAEQARARLLSGERWQDVARFYDESHAPLDGTWYAKGVRLPQLDRALEKMPMDGISEVVETENGFFVMQRIR